MSTADAKADRGAEVFSGRVAIILFLVGVFSFSAFITLSTFAPELREGDVRAHALSQSAVGYAGVVKLLRATGAHVTVSRSEPSFTQNTASLVVLTPDEKVTHDDISRLARTSTVLIVLPKWLVLPSMKRKGHVTESEPMWSQSIQGILDDIAPEAKVTRATGRARPDITIDWRKTRVMMAGSKLRPGAIDSLQTITAKNIQPIATDKNGGVVFGVIPQDDEHDDVFVLAEPDLLNTQGIADKATASVGLDILNSLRVFDTITFDVTLNGYARSRSLMRLALEPPLLAATLSFVIVAALIAWRAATRDGPTVLHGRALAYGKRILADNSAALIRLAGREHTMAPRYADFIRSVVAERIGVARDGVETTSAELDRIAAARGMKEPFSTLAAEATNAQSGVAALVAARKLHTWTEEIIRATR